MPLINLLREGTGAQGGWLGRASGTLKADQRLRLWIAALRRLISTKFAPASSNWPVHNIRFLGVSTWPMNWMSPLAARHSSGPISKPVARMSALFRNSAAMMPAHQTPAGAAAVGRVVCGPVRPDAPEGVEARPPASQRKINTGKRKELISTPLLPGFVVFDRATRSPACSLFRLP